MTDRIKDFLARNPEEGPRLVVDLEVVRENYLGFAKALPDTRVFYAVKANPAPEFSNSSPASARASTPPRWSRSSKRSPPARRRTASASATRSRRSGTSHGPMPSASSSLPSIANPRWKDRARRSRRKSLLPHPLRRRRRRWPLRASSAARRTWRPGAGIRPPAGARRPGLSFHVGSQQRNPRMWDSALKASAAIFRDLAERGIQLTMLNLGGGFPTRYLKDVPAVRDLRPDDLCALRRHFGNRIPETIIEPGRGMVGNAGIIEAEVVLISQQVRGRAASLGLSRHRQVQRPRRDDGRDDPLPHPHRRSTGTRWSPAWSPGPTCNSVDVLYEKEPYPLPIGLEIGSKVLMRARAPTRRPIPRSASTDFRR